MKIATKILNCNLQKLTSLPPPHTEEKSCLRHCDMITVENKNDKLTLIQRPKRKKLRIDI